MSVSLQMAFQVSSFCLSRPKRLCHYFLAVTSNVAPTSPNYFHKSLLNVFNLSCYTNCLLCFSHFHMLTHPQKIRLILFCGRVFNDKSGKLERKCKKGAKYFDKHLLMQQFQCQQLFLFAKRFLMSYMLLKYKSLKVQSHFPKKYLVITRPLTQTYNEYTVPNVYKGDWISVDHLM